MGHSRIRAALAAAVVAASCAPMIDEANRPCPCATGYVCCGGDTCLVACPSADDGSAPPASEGGSASPPVDGANEGSASRGDARPSEAVDGTAAESAAPDGSADAPGSDVADVAADETLADASDGRTTATAIPNGVYRVRTLASQGASCLDWANEGADGTAIEALPCVDAPEQLWSFDRVEDGLYSIRSTGPASAGGGFMGIADADGGDLLQAVNFGDAATPPLWSVTSLGGGRYALQPAPVDGGAASCVDVGDVSGPIQTAACVGSIEESFVVAVDTAGRQPYLPGGAYRITLGTSATCVGEGASSAATTVDCGDPSALWQLASAEDEAGISYDVIQAADGRCLDWGADAGDAGAGPRVAIATCDGETTQLWSVGGPTAAEYLIQVTPGPFRDVTSSSLCLTAPSPSGDLVLIECGTLATDASSSPYSFGLVEP